MNYEINQNSSNAVDIPLLGSVLDQGRMTSALSHFNIETLYHAAAYKHVPIVEHNVINGVVNNAFGTRSAALAAADTGVRRFILISTDKAVRPTNVMGASKRLSELILQTSLRASDIVYSISDLETSGLIWFWFQYLDGNPRERRYRPTRRLPVTL